MMKAIQIEKPFSIGITEVDKPTQKTNEALVKIVTAGICGSDVSAYRGGNNLVNYPLIIGHELAGVIEEISPNNKGLKVGDRVILDPYIYCGDCYPCKLGRTNCCTNLRVLGVQTTGGMSNYICHPVELLIKIPDEMTWEEASMVEPLTISLHGIHRGRLQENEYCAIIGAGPIGVVAAMVAKAYNAIPIIIDIVDERLNFARSLGITYTINSDKENLVDTISNITSGNMAQLVMECSGSNSAIRDCLDIVSNAGRITLTGWPKNETSLPTDIITKKELDVLGARTSVNEFQESINLILSKSVDMNLIHMKTIVLDQVPQYIEDMNLYPNKYMKVIVKISEL